MVKETKLLYTKEDLNKAYYMGLETAVSVIENSMGLTRKKQQKLLEYMRRKIIDSKISALKGN